MLIPDAKRVWWRLWSVQINLAGAGLLGVASVMGSFAGMPWAVTHPFLMAGIAAVVSMAAVGARLLPQDKLNRDDPPL